MDFAEYLAKRGVRPSMFGKIAKVYPNIVLCLVRKERSSITLENAIKILNECEGKVNINDLLSCIGSQLRYSKEEDLTSVSKTRTKRQAA